MPRARAAVSHFLVVALQLGADGLHHLRVAQVPCGLGERHGGRSGHVAVALAREQLQQRRHDAQPAVERGGEQHVAAGLVPARPEVELVGSRDRSAREL
jgi:hypothetical protein